MICVHLCHLWQKKILDGIVQIFTIMLELINDTDENGVAVSSVNLWEKNYIGRYE